MPVNDFSTQLTNLLKALGTGKIATVLLLIGGMVTGFVFLMMWTGKPDFQLLYANLDSEDAAVIVGKLRDNKIPYQLSSNGGSILVPENKLYDTRLDLASEGIPQGSGVGFEIFDNTKLGMTEFVQNVNYQRAIQGELARTIKRLSEVESARVHIVMPSKSLFIDGEKPATASVVLKIHRGRSLSGDQIQGIVHLVSSSVSDLSPENVTIVNNSGKMLAGFKKGSSAGHISSDQLAYQEKMEKNLEERIETMLYAALGPGKATVKVSCALDFKRHEMTEERYQPDTTVVRSEQLSNETTQGGEDIPMGIPGVASNLAGGKKGVTLSSQNPSAQRQDRTVNYEISKVVSHTVDPVGTLQRVSVAVIVDGTYTSVSEKRGKEDFKYIPRTEEEMKKFEDIVKRAVNYDPERGDEITVANIPFESTKLQMSIAGEKFVEEGWLPKLRQYTSFIKYGLFAMFILFSFTFVVRPLINWLTSGSFGESNVFGQLPKTVAEVEQQYGNELGKLPNRTRALEMISSDSEGSASLMKDWLKET